MIAPHALRARLLLHVLHFDGRCMFWLRDDVQNVYFLASRASGETGEDLTRLKYTTPSFSFLSLSECSPASGTSPVWNSNKSQISMFIFVERTREPIVFQVSKSFSAFHPHPWVAMSVRG